MHMAGVVLLFVAAVVGAALRGRGAILPLATGCALYALRVVLKAAAIVMFEMLRSRALLPFSRVWREEVFERSMAIMFRGADACSNPTLTLPVFRMCGVLQWVVFYVFLMIM